MRTQRLAVAGSLASAAGLAAVGYGTDHPALAGAAVVLGVILPARYWEAVKPGRPGAHLRLRAQQDPVAWVQDRPQDHVPTDRAAGGRRGPRPRSISRLRSRGDADR